MLLKMRQFLLVSYYRYRDGIRYPNPNTNSDETEGKTVPPLHSSQSIFCDSAKTLYQILVVSRESAKKAEWPLFEECFRPYYEDSEDPHVKLGNDVASNEIGFFKIFHAPPVGDKDGKQIQAYRAELQSLLTIEIYTPQEAEKIWGAVALCRPLGFELGRSAYELAELENSFIGKWLQGCEEWIANYQDKREKGIITASEFREDKLISAVESEPDFEGLRFRNTIAAVLCIFHDKVDRDVIESKTNEISVHEFRDDYRESGNKPVFSKDEMHFRDIAIFVRKKICPGDGNTQILAAVNKIPGIKQVNAINHSNFDHAIKRVQDMYFKNCIKPAARINFSRKKKKGPLPEPEKSQEKNE